MWLCVPVMQDQAWLTISDHLAATRSNPHTWVAEEMACPR